jgi:hypothetical protein
MASVVLIIADISGYTRFMTRTKMSLAHAQAIITELLQSILHEIEIPLHVVEIEGDAVFFYGIEESGVYGWEQTIALISRKLLVFFSRFYQRLDQLQRSNMCHCNACRHVADLRLKLIVHVGEAMFYHIANFAKLSGPDVILVHRLVKNSIRGSEYLLMTERAHNEIRQYQEFDVQKAIETYDELGQVPVYVHYPHLTEMPSTEEGTVSFAQKLKETLTVVTKGMAFRTGLRTPPKMRNLSGCTAPSSQE